jgi:molybdopterin-guanine dinucleotide biosynthesis protein
MSKNYLFSSLCRISDLQSCSFGVSPLGREQWATGDYVVGEVISPPGKLSFIELTTGRMVEVVAGDAIIGAFGIRRATLEIVGDWQHIEADNRMEALTEGGLFGRETSRSFMIPSPASLVYRGHVVRQQQKVCMQDFVPKLPERRYDCPTIMIIGTSMSSGKTTAARVIIHLLKQAGLKVVGTKLTGAGQYHDILTMSDAGADQVFDFVDVGLPSSIASPEDFRMRLRQLLSAIASEEPDVVVAEAGASPSETYNGSVVLEEIKEQIRCLVLCAADPYAVMGFSQSFGLTPDLITGITTSTTAAVELVEKLTGVVALTLPDNKSIPKLTQILTAKLGL